MKFEKAFFDDLLVSQPVEALAVEGANRIAKVARSSAPVDTGGYRSKIRVKTKRQKRVVAQVIAEDGKSMIIESKTGNLVRALRQVGRG